jgi:hypothetical protein
VEHERVQQLDRAAPASIGRMRSARPSRNGTPIGSRRLFAAPKVAAEIALCARFLHMDRAIARE